MIKMITAKIEEIDDIDIAVSEIEDQLNISENLLTNSVGILSCYCEFIDTGVVSALASALPFDIVGCTTLGNGTETGSGVMSLCLSVLTSDDVRFTTYMSAPLTSDFDTSKNIISEAYKKAKDSLDGEPKLLIPFLPLLDDLGGDIMLGMLDSASGRIPTFGTLACDQYSDYHATRTICNQKSSKDCISFLLMSGEINPRFLIATISEDNIQSQKAVITDSQGSLLKSVNDVTAANYLKSVGLDTKDGIEGLSAVPFLINHNDGTKPSARVIYMVTEEGYAVAGGAMPIGGTLAVGTLESSDILKTTKKLIEDILKIEAKSCMLMFPCLSRSLILGSDMLGELNLIKNCISGKIPYHVCYSGGEYCPVYKSDNTTKNRFHNFSVIACLF